MIVIGSGECTEKPLEEGALNEQEMLTVAKYLFKEKNFWRRDIGGLEYLVGATGFEPATTRPPDEHSTMLSYAPKFLYNINEKAKLLCKRKRPR